MIHLFKIMELCKLTAISTKLQPTEESIWRSIQRDYSSTFNTPLHLVSSLNPEEMLIHLCEHQLESLDISEQKDLQRLLDNLYSIENPNYEAEKDAAEEKINQQILAEEIESQKKKAAKRAAIQKNTSENKEPVKELPKSGGVNLAYLSEMADKEG